MRNAKRAMCIAGDAMALARFLLCCAALCCAGWATSVPDNPDSTHGTFVQRKILADVDVTLVSKGEFRFEKDKFFEWKVLSPVPSLFHATPTNWATTVRGRTSVHPLDVDVSSLSKVFEIKEMKEYVESVETKPDGEFPKRIEVKFKNGDRLEIDMVQSR